jgi:hypothetical protein
MAKLEIATKNLGLRVSAEGSVAVIIACAIAAAILYFAVVHI